MEKISIVIPVYNGADYLGAAIRSALEQTWENKEIIVVNDGSNDNGATREVVERYQDKITYYEKPNGGTATALNYGIERMKGTYFSWLSHDDLYLPDKLRHQMLMLGKGTDPTQIIAGNYVLINEHGIPFRIMDFYQLYGEKNLKKPLLPVFHCAVNGCTLLIHKSHFDRVGLFREDLRTTQDYDLWFRMFRGKSVLYTKELDVISRVHQAQTSVRYIDTHEEECSELWLRLFESLNDQEKEMIGGDLDTFYADMYNHFKYHTSYGRVAAELGKHTDRDDISLRKQEKRKDRLLNSVRMQWIYWKYKPLIIMRG